MIETITLITLSLLLMSILRPGKTPPLDNPLVIERPGQYHMTLAPKINLAQPFIEAVAKQMGTPNDATQYSETQFFEVSDNQVTAHGHNCYLLAITLRNGMLYCQADSPSIGAQNDHRNTIREFADTVLVRFPATGEHNTALDEHIVTAAQEAAQLRKIHIKYLTQERPQ
jgi:hypothetical protein